MGNILRRKFRYSFFNATLIIIAINVAVFVLTGCGRSMRAAMVFGIWPLYFIEGHCFWQVFTYMFMHGSWAHLIGNMLGLLIFGISAENKIGSKEFLLFYLLCGIASGAASLVTYILSGTVDVFLIGASGAVYSVLLLFATLFPTARIFVFWVLPVPAPLLIVIYAGISVWEEIFGMNKGVAHLTHLFGFAAAWVYCLVRFGVNPVKIWKNAWR